MTGDEVGVSLDALCDGCPAAVTCVMVPHGDGLVAAAGRSTDYVVVSAVRGPHKCRVNTDDADERFVKAGPIAGVSTAGEGFFWGSD